MAWTIGANITPRTQAMLWVVGGIVRSTGRKLNALKGSNFRTVHITVDVQGTWWNGKDERSTVVHSA